MGISTHILNTALGKPAAGVTVTLQMLKETDWVALHVDSTDTDGRCKQMLPGAIESGTYRLRFETADYFRELGVAGLYPFVEIVFEVRPGAGDHFHIPLLLTANSYTTYRGS
jgi:5-hydroxyisourate hydrolase